MAESYPQTIQQGGTSRQKAKQYLLPLLTPSRDTLHSSSPPLHLLPPKGKLPQERITFQTSSKYGKTSWIESSHLFPSAYPRFEAGQRLLIPSQKVATDLAKELASCNQPQQWTLAQRITPVRPCTEGNTYIVPKGRGLTVVITQVGKFDKKEWEQIVYKLVSELEKNETQHIEEIWLLIGDLLEQKSSYEDSIRDVEQFLHFYLPVPSSKDELKRYGPHWLENTLRKHREKLGKNERILIGLGHVCPAKLKLFDGMIAAYAPNEKEGNTIAETIKTFTNWSKREMRFPGTHL